MMVDTMEILSDDCLGWILVEKKDEMRAVRMGNWSDWLKAAQRVV